MKNLHLALQNLRRHPLLSLATLLTLSSLLIILTLSLTLQNYTNSRLQDLNHNIELVFELQPNLTEAESRNFVQDLESRPEIKKVTFLPTAPKGFESMHPELIETLTSLEIENPFPPQISLTVSSPTDHSLIREHLKTLPNIVNPTSLEITEGPAEISFSASSALVKLSSSTQQIFQSLSIILSLAFLAIILNSTYLSLLFRQQEISIMRLLGASFSRIYLPYLSENILLSVFSVIFANLIFILLIPLSPSSQSFWNLPLSSLLTLEIISLILVSIISSFLATNYFLRRNNPHL